MLIIIFVSVVQFACSKNTNTDIVNSENYIAELSIFSYDGKSETKNLLKNYGHSFFTIKNISENDIYLGNYKIKQNEIVSCGIWSITTHFGIWYNVESNYIEFCDKYNGRVSITKNINIEDLDRINKFMENNDIWLPFKNCSYFCINIWNCVANNGEKIKTKFLTSPSYLVDQLKNFNGYEVNRDIITDKIFGYFKGENFVKHAFREGDLL